MLAKSWNQADGRYEVTFDLPGDLDVERAAVVGEFNDWDESATPMTRQGDGRLAATVSLEPGRSYRFRYHLGEDRWENDWSADDYVPNDFGGSDSLVEVPDAPSEPPAAKKAGAKKGPAKKKAAAKKKAVKKKAATKKKATTKKAATKKATKKRASGGS